LKIHGLWLYKVTEGPLCKFPGTINFQIYFCTENNVSLVHGSWTTGTPVHHGPASIVSRRSTSELSLLPLWATTACCNCMGRMRNSSGFRLGPHPTTERRHGDRVMTVVSLGESDAQASREGKESRGRCGGGRWGSSLFLGAEGGGQWLRRRNGQR
jgi:hypothetical protein